MKIAFNQRNPSHDFPRAAHVFAQMSASVEPKKGAFTSFGKDASFGGTWGTSLVSTRTGARHPFDELQIHLDACAVKDACVRKGQERQRQGLRSQSYSIFRHSWKCANKIFVHFYDCWKNAVAKCLHLGFYDPWDSWADPRALQA